MSCGIKFVCFFRESLREYRFGALVDRKYVNILKRVNIACNCLVFRDNYFCCRVFLMFY